ncbi:hypothetical protein QYE76_008141 [Lolium multiflorum]|uniref:Retrotransposon gag domain-containing protein n=1 Tax=Lolium multiflorum TaxID=4521 RepID=A0AAD8QJ48_LOLMU|nr:hypothetical protein QYE76_008141 [Lolium multiflorum]
MAYAVTIPRHLAPTVGPSASSAGVFIRTGLTITTGERVASGLIWRFGSLDCVSDNAGCFADRPFPAGGSVISFGGHDVYVATVAPPRYPRQVLRCASPPPRAGSSAPASPAVVQVMMAGEELPTKNPRTRGPNLERNIDPNASGSGPKAPPPPSRLDEVRTKLSSPLTAGGDAATVEADLEAHRQLLLQQADELAAAKRQLAITQREYEHAHGFTPGGNNPSRAGMIRKRGGGLGAEIERDGAEAPAPSTELPVYNTPDKNILAAEAASKELALLEGEELRRQTQRVADLCRAAAEQTKDPRYGASKAPPVRAAAGTSKDPHRDTAESASPAPSRHRDSRDTRAGSSRTSRLDGGHSGRSRPPPNRNEEHDSGGGAKAPAQAGSRANRHPQPARSRLGPRIEPVDARDRLDRLVESRIAEEEAPACPKCFGPRIANEPMLDGFQLPRDTPNRHLQRQQALGGALLPPDAVGSARTWLNNLPAGSINGWLDFEEAFISNFTGTYRRPGRPQQLEMCKQGPDETDRAYLTRWCEMRNSCEGVHEIQAIMGGCRPNTMLWHKLRRSEPKSMAALMAIADKYALAEEAGKATADPAPAPSRRDHHKSAEHKPADGASHGSRWDNYRGKRHSDQPDRRYGSAHVAAVADNAAGGSRR